MTSSTKHWLKFLPDRRWVFGSTCPGLCRPSCRRGRPPRRPIASYGRRRCSERKSSSRGEEPEIWRSPYFLYFPFFKERLYSNYNTTEERDIVVRQNWPEIFSWGFWGYKSDIVTCIILSSFSHLEEKNHFACEQ